MAYLPLEKYGVVGDLRTAALVGVNGSIDFFCFPRFDSPSVFQALLDDEKGGRFAITPLVDEANCRQLYLPDSNVLLTRILADAGVAEISDFMPLDTATGTPQIVRRVKTVRGEVRYRVVCAPRFDHARARHRAAATEDGVVFTPDARHLPALRLRGQVPLRVKNGDAVAEFTLRAGESAAFVLAEARHVHAIPADVQSYASQSFKDTLNYWRRWIARSSYRGRWRETVNRSALALKLLTSREYGSIVAAPTFGLPEVVGGERNWDYRFTWVRDASFTIYALLRLGYTEEAGEFMRWFADRGRDANPDGSVQPVYGIDGQRVLIEETVPNLAGYAHTGPVRIGNDAYRQVQLDVYGELMDSVYLYDKYGALISSELWENLVRLVDWVCDNWQRPDDGIWEVRGGVQEFCLSRTMCWVAVDRAMRLARNRSFPAPIARWHAVRDEIYHSVFRDFWNTERRAFVQHKGSSAMGAGNLLMPLLRFISPADPRWLSTLRAIEHDLVSDSLVYRYKTEQAPDGLGGQEGTFTVCSFWYVEALARAGDVEQARLLFEKLVGYASDLGLYSEQLSPRGEQLGNFPLGLTHIGLISAAYDLNRRLEAAGQSG
ncbi:MAG TPA: glycoside hydrolase family 15 protein [bacterium]|nr:glycoside hydrolase family 15 protein [bacterium]